MSQLAKILADHRHGRAFLQSMVARNANHPTEERVVDDRSFCLGLDELHRTGLKEHEQAELLVAAREVARALGVTPTNEPVDGYYMQTDQLREYAQLMRALRGVEASAKPKVEGLRDFQILSQVAASPLFGEPTFNGMLFPTARDALTRAMDSAGSWTVMELSEMAYRVAEESNECSLVALASLTRDPVTITAVREQVAYYPAPATMGLGPMPLYPWKVSEIVAKRAAAFVTTFNTLLGEEMPKPTAENADYFGAAAHKQGDIGGRCVKLGQQRTPTAYYHWAIVADAQKRLEISEFWAPEVWTTARFRQGAPG